jgi:hypothetical protein
LCIVDHDHEQQTILITPELTIANINFCEVLEAFAVRLDLHASHHVIPSSRALSGTASAGSACLVAFALGCMTP